MGYTLGLDIGISSIGWAVLDWERQKIDDLGVRLFEKAEQPSGDSLAAPRREARGTRRRLHRKAQRMKSLRQLMVSQHLLTEHELETLYDEAGDSPWELRAVGLDRLLTPTEWARVLLHLAKRRGFKSNRTTTVDDSGSKQNEDGKANAAMKANAAVMKSEDGKAVYRTAGEMMWKDPRFEDRKRNSTGCYIGTLGRQMVKEEIEALFAAQRAHGSDCASEKFEKHFLECWGHQLPFASGESIVSRIGSCSLEPEHKRAAKATWTAESFMLYSEIAKLRIRAHGEAVILSPEQIQAIADEARNKAKLTYKQLRKLLDLGEENVFPLLPVPRENKDPDGAESKKKAKNPEEKVFVELKAFHEFRKAISGALGIEKWEELITTTPEVLDQLGTALTHYKTDADIRENLKSQNVDEALIEAVLPLNFQKVMHLSLEAMRKLIPHMKQGLGYYEACQAAGYNLDARSGNGARKLELPLPDGDEIRNPVVYRALCQVRRLVNALMRHYGPFDAIHVELARELKKSAAQRAEIERKQRGNKKDKDRLKEDYKKTFGYDPNGLELLKYRLWIEQGGFCVYSQKYIGSELFNDKEALAQTVEVDHILPYSRSFDDGYANKVLVFGDENRRKKNQTPWEYIGSQGEERWNLFVAYVESLHHLSRRKKELLKKKDFGEKASEEWKSRQLQDTQYIVRYVANWIEQHLAFSPAASKRPVVRLNGQGTSLMRWQWGMDALKDRDSSDLHHALDACVIAAATHGMVQRISEYSQKRESQTFKMKQDEKGRLYFPQPWDKFRKEVEARLSPDPVQLIKEKGLKNYSDDDLASLQPVFISMQGSRKVTGEAHGQTIRSARWLEEKGATVVKLPLEKLTDKTVEKMVGKDDDRRLYEALKKHLESCEAKDIKTPFAQPFYKPTKSGAQGPVVRSVKVFSSEGISGQRVREGIASNGSMVRLDFYRKKGKYYMIPYYVSDIARKLKKNKAITVGKSEKEWTVIDDAFEFCFSVSKHDYLVVTYHNGKTTGGYYKTANRNNGSIELYDPLTKTTNQVSPKTALSIEKYQVDILGNRTRIKKEKPRHGLA